MKTINWLASLTIVLAMTACGKATDLEGDSGGGEPERLVISSQDYYSNEILAEVPVQRGSPSGRAGAGTRPDRSGPAH